MFDIAASQRVLEKTVIGRGGDKMHIPVARLEEAAQFLYRLDKSKFRTKR